MSTTETSATGNPKDLSLEEISNGYAGNWVAITVTKRDVNFQPMRGIVVASDADRYRLRASITQYKDICILFAGDIPFRLML